jgi:hypothetical protein
MLMGFLVTVFSFLVIAVIGFMVHKHLEVEFEKEVSDFIAKARAVEAERRNSCIVFTPEDREQAKFFQKMWRKGIVKQNPLSTGGYILDSSYIQIWKDYAGFTKTDVVHVKEKEV